jgi:hypothetical protein
LQDELQRRVVNWYRLSVIPRLLSSAPRIAVLGLAIAAAIARSFPAGAV